MLWLTVLEGSTDGNLAQLGNRIMEAGTQRSKPFTSQKQKGKGQGN